MPDKAPAKARWFHLKRGPGYTGKAEFEPDSDFKKWKIKRIIFSIPRLWSSKQNLFKLRQAVASRLCTCRARSILWGFILPNLILLFIREGWRAQPYSICTQSLGDWKAMEADPVTLFTILDLSPDSGAEVVKKRCQEKLLKLHPDKNGGSESPEYHKVSCWGMILKKARWPIFGST